jgi:hypothetical protein
MSQNYWELNQQNLIVFVLVDNAGLEVVGLGNAFVLEISKSGGVFVPSTGTKAEIGSGFYSYLTTVAEADTIGPVAVKITGVGAVQQNLIYTIIQLTTNLTSFTYTVTNSITGLPIASVNTWIATDTAINNIVWQGVTDTFGVARDQFGNLPWLNSGTYYVKCQKSGFMFAIDTEVV